MLFLYHHVDWRLLQITGSESYVKTTGELFVTDTVFLFISYHSTRSVGTHLSLDLRKRLVFVEEPAASSIDLATVTGMLRISPYSMLVFIINRYLYS